VEKKNPIFDEIYRDYLAQVAEKDLTPAVDRLGIRVEGRDALVPFLGTTYRVSSDGITDDTGQRPIHSVSVVLSKYLLMCPETDPTGEDWVCFRDFKDSGPFAQGFEKNAERAVAKNFVNRVSELVQASKTLGGRPPNVELSYEVAMRFDSLPRVPIFLLFNDEDEEFPSQCSLLFESRAEHYLDMECLAIAGWLLADYLGKAAGISGETIM
jgi:Domain of unknown function (DUF3786)